MIQCRQAVDVIENGETVRIDFGGGTLMCKADTLDFTPLPDFVQKILNDGGLIPHTKKKLRS